MQLRGGTFISTYNIRDRVGSEAQKEGQYRCGLKPALLIEDQKGFLEKVTFLSRV